MEAKERIKYYENALRLLEGKKFKNYTLIHWVTPNWFKNESGVCELFGLLHSNFEKIGRNISQFHEFEIFRPTLEEQAEEQEPVFWWEENNRIARVIALTMCIEMAKGNIDVN